MTPLPLLEPDELGDDILLSTVEGVGSLTYRRLLESFGTPEAILRVGRRELRQVGGVSEKVAEAIATVRDTMSPEGPIRVCRQNGIAILSIRDRRYPETLRQIDDPPPLLYVRGELLPRDVFALAVIGTRRMSSYGSRMTRRIAGPLAVKGVTIISGLAKGVDGVAHRAALDVGGRTIAVLGSGHLRLYPPEHEELADEIVKRGAGAVLSEYHPLHEAAKWTFPQRNRIVSGLSLGVLVVEAPLASGTMITASLAGEQGRDVFAVPGAADHEPSRGCHRLIRDGATLVESAEDILERLGPLPEPVELPIRETPLHHPAELSINDVESEVLRHIPATPISVQNVVDRSGLASHQVLAALGALETQGIIRFESRTHVARF